MTSSPSAPSSSTHDAAVQEFAVMGSARFNAGFALAAPKQQEAMLRIHLLAEVQSVLLGDFEVGSLGSFDDFIIE